MVDFPIDTGIRKIGDSILTPLQRDAQVKCFTTDITILLSNTNVLGTIVVDFAYTQPSIVDYTLDGGLFFIAFNQGVAVTGGQSRFIDVTTGNKINFRAKTLGSIIRCVVSSVP